MMDPVVSFKSSPTSIEAFTRGACLDLAISLAQEFNLDSQAIRQVVVFNGDQVDSNYWDTHYVLLAPPDYIKRFNLPSDQPYYLDIIGLWTESSLLRYWENTFLTCDKTCCERIDPKTFSCQLKTPIASELRALDIPDEKFYNYLQKHVQRIADYQG